MGKITKIKEQLEKYNLDAVIITKPVNRRYITGFTGTAGMAIVGLNKAVFITDFRYTKQAGDQVKDFEIVEHKQGLIPEVKEQLKKMEAKRVGFEKNNVTFAGYEQLKEQIEGELVPTEQIVEQLRLYKTDEELALMKQAAKIADDAFLHIQKFIKPGVKEIEISNELEFFMRREGATSSSFDTIVASGYRSALPHGVASRKEIQSGELVTMDYGALYNGYCSDMTRTVAVGEPDDSLKEIYDTVLQAQLRGVQGVKPGMTGKQADALTRDYIESKGYGSYFGHSTGHGLGMEVHENPSLSIKSDTVLKAGMVVTIEPGIYIPDVGGCRIEDDIVITESGNERLTKAPKDLIIL